MNSAVLAKSGDNLTLKNITVIISAAGANGVSLSNDSSSGDGTTITISDSKIITNADNSGGIMTTGGGVVTVSGGTYKTKGQGSPTIYYTADVIVR